MLKDLALQEHTGLMKYDQVHISSQNGFLDATCGFYMQLKIKSFIQKAITIPQHMSKRRINFVNSFA